MKYVEEIKNYLGSHSNGEKLIEFFINVYIPNEEKDVYKLRRTYSCGPDCPPWMDTYYDIYNKYIQYSRKQNVSELYDLINDMYQDNTEVKEFLLNIISKYSEYELRTYFGTFKDFIHYSLIFSKYSKYAIRD